MNNRPVHENLDTSFVNLSALVRYLRRRQFVGRVRLELNSYEADIVLEEGNKIKVREHDKISGRIAEGEEALQRLLIRAREPGGTIHVYQFVENAEIPKVEVKTSIIEQKQVQKETVTELPKISHAPQLKPNPAIGSAVKPVQIADIAPKVNRPKFPFELKNSVEEKARQNQINPAGMAVIININ